MHDPAKAEAFRQVKAGPQPDLRGGRKHLSTARHFLEIDHFGYTSHLKKLIRNFG
jgi:hypothetical protein